MRDGSFLSLQFPDQSRPLAPYPVKKSPNSCQMSTGEAGCFSRRAWRRLRPSQRRNEQPKTPGRDPMPASSPSDPSPAVRQRLLSLAHLSLIQSAPLQLVSIAEAAGFDLVDLRLSPATPTDRVYGKSELAELCRELPPILDGAGLRVWDVEIVRVQDQTRPGDYLYLMETAAILGAQRMKLVCDSED